MLTQNVVIGVVLLLAAIVALLFGSGAVQAVGAIVAAQHHKLKQGQSILVHAS